MAEIKGFHPSISIYTDKGWKNVTEITTKDVVASMNVFTRQVYYKPVNKTYINKYSGELYTQIKSHSLNFSAIPNSKLLCYLRNDPSPFYISVKESIKQTNLQRSNNSDKSLYYIRKHNGWQGINADKVKITFKDRHKEYKTTDFLKVLGWFYTNGLFIRDRDPYIVFLAPQKHVIPFFLRDMQQIGYKIKEHYSSAGISTKLKKCGVKNLLNFTITDKVFSQYLKQNIIYNIDKGMWEKRIPKNILDLDYKFLKVLFDTILFYVDRDKDKKYGRGKDYGSFYMFRSRECAEDFYTLSIKCGRQPKIRIMEKWYRGNKDEKYIVYEVSLGNSYDKLVAGFTKQTYTGKIYGIETAPYNTLLVKCPDEYFLWMADSSK